MVDIRWNTFYLMLARIEELSDALALFFQNPKYADFLITPAEWEIIRELIHVLRPLYLATKQVNLIT